MEQQRCSKLSRRNNGAAGRLMNLKLNVKEMMSGGRRQVQWVAHSGEPELHVMLFTVGMGQAEFFS